MNPVDDDIRARLAARRNWSVPGAPECAYTARVIEERDLSVVLELYQGGTCARVVVPLPSSLRPTPWTPPCEQDADRWVGDLWDWMDEEMFSGGGLGPDYGYEMRPDGRYLTIAGYGFRRADPDEHRRLGQAVGPHGWHRTMRRNRRSIRRQHALQWALDQAEADLIARQDALPDDPHDLGWSLHSPDGVAVGVEVLDVDVDLDRSIAHLGASSGLLRNERAERRFVLPWL